MLTQFFKSGNSMAVRIPKSLWPAVAGTPVELRKEGDHLVIYPLQVRLDGAMEAFGAFDARFMSEGRENPDETERSW